MIIVDSTPELPRRICFMIFLFLAGSFLQSCAAVQGGEANAESADAKGMVSLKVFFEPEN